MRGKWPNDKLESQMIFDAEYVADQYGGTAAKDVVCHVKALLARIRELEVKAKELESIVEGGECDLS